MTSCAASKNVLKDETKGNKTDKVFLDTYSSRLGITLNQGCNKKLIETLASWLNTPYKSGGNTKQGIDCSGFVKLIYADVYGISMARSSAEIYAQCKKINRFDLKEGDLVFFKINTPYVGHVGIYLTNDYFIHASTHKGVIVSSIKDSYYATFFYSAGSVR